MTFYIKHFPSICFVLLLWSGCSVEPKPIDYGSDACTHCMMNIVDNTHASELVTNKGKVFKFDAIECMVNQLRKDSITEFAYMLVCDFSEPGKFIDARSAHYLISPEIPSPMGANLSAFSQQDHATRFEGRVYSWEELFEVLK